MLLPSLCVCVCLTKIDWFTLIRKSVSNRCDWWYSVDRATSINKSTYFNAIWLQMQFISTSAPCPMSKYIRCYIENCNFTTFFVSFFFLYAHTSVRWFTLLLENCSLFDLFHSMWFTCIWNASMITQVSSNEITFLN